MKQRASWLLALGCALALSAIPVQAANSSKQAHVPPAATQQAAKERTKIIAEAVTALEKTRAALAALDAGETQKALNLLSEATGKLEIITTAHPDLALAPVDVRVVVRDFPGDAKAIHAAVEKASDLLDDGKVQEARHLLEGLASEVDVQVYYLPLATYPQAIKHAVRLLAQKKRVEAASVLQTALDTLVVVDHITPLPIVHAQEFLAQARTFVGKKRRLNAAQTKHVQALLASAKAELERARALGYLDEKRYEAMLEDVEALEDKLAKHGDTRSLLDALRKKVDEFLKEFTAKKQ